VRELRAHGTTVLLTTHYMDEAERLCDHVAIVAEGKVIGEGRPRDLIIRHLAHETVELDCAPHEEAALLDGLRLAPHRLRAGQRLHVYVENAAPLVEHIRARDRDHQRALVVRPTNLEDVFLALTGTKLEAGA
jgi:lipooligosaccharide transport system ATP-binding protein